MEGSTEGRKKGGRKGGRPGREKPAERGAQRTNEDKPPCVVLFIQLSQFDIFLKGGLIIWRKTFFHSMKDSHIHKYMSLFYTDTSESYTQVNKVISRKRWKCTFSFLKSVTQKLWYSMHDIS